MRVVAWKPGDLRAEAMPGLAPEEPPSPGAERQPGGSWMEGDPMYENYQWVAMLQPTELADGEFYDRDPAELPTPAGTTIARVYAAARYGRETWWAELSPAEGSYGPRCSCCPLLYGRDSDRLEFLVGNTRPTREESSAWFTYTSTFLVALDVQTGICVSVDHLDGSQTGEALTARILGVDEPMSDDIFAKPSMVPRLDATTRAVVQRVRTPRE